MNYRDKLKQEPVAVRVAQPIEVGKLVSYYWNGWRTGTLESLSKTTARIRPMIVGMAFKRLLSIDINDIKPYEGRTKC